MRRGAPGPSGAGAPSLSSDALFAQAFARHQAGDLARAEALYRQALARRPGDAEGLHLLGLVCAQSGRLEDATGLIRQALAHKPDFDLAHFNLGNVLRRSGRPDEAAEAYRRALALKPDHAGALLNLGAVLRELGQAGAAVEIYRRALVLRPDAAEAHYNLGLALQHLGRMDEAVIAYRRVVARTPADADAWANLGAALLSLGRVSEALDARRRWLALAPASAEAHRALSAALLEAGCVDEAVDAGRRAVTLQPGDADAHSQLGAALLERGATAEATLAYRCAAELHPGGVDGWVNLAVALQEAGETAGARSTVTRALEVDPRSAAAWAVYAGLKTFRAGDPDLDALQAMDAAGGLAPEDRISLAFTLGKAFMDIGDTDRAFAHLDVGNRLHRSTLSYEVQGDVEQFETLAQTFTPGTLARRAGQGHASDRPIFIVGMPRSGTTLVEQILASHPQVFGAGELSLLERLVIDRLGPSLSPTERARRLADLTAADLDALGAAYTAGVSALAPEAARITDKMPSNLRLAGLIRLILPNARIVSCRRDPIDTGLSCYARKFSRGQPFAYDLRELGTYARAYGRLADHWRDVLPPDCLLEVNYEDVVADLEGQARRLIAFCGLGWDDACLDFHQKARTVRTASVNQVRQPIYGASVRRWKAYERHLGPLIEALGA